MAKVGIEEQLVEDRKLGEDIDPEHKEEIMMDAELKRKNMVMMDKEQQRKNSLGRLPG